MLILISKTQKKLTVDNFLVGVFLPLTLQTLTSSIDQKGLLSTGNSGFVVSTYKSTESEVIFSTISLTCLHFKSDWKQDVITLSSFSYNFTLLPIILSTSFVSPSSLIENVIEQFSHNETYSDIQRTLEGVSIPRPNFERPSSSVCRNWSKKCFFYFQLKLTDSEMKYFYGSSTV